MSLEALLFHVLCVIALFAMTMSIIEYRSTRNKKPTQRSSAEQATRNTPTHITK